MTDPLARLRRDERWAGHVVAAATGAEALPHDVGGAQSAVDITLHYPDGRTGALEVTSHAAGGANSGMPASPTPTTSGPTPAGGLGVSGSARP